MTCDTEIMSARRWRRGSLRAGRYWVVALVTVAMPIVATVASGCAQPVADADTESSKYETAARLDRVESGGRTGDRDKIPTSPSDRGAPSTEPSSRGTPTTVAGSQEPSTATAPTTTTNLPELLPIPIDPPLDVYGPEPRIELGRIEIPAIGIDSVLYQGIRLTTLDRGPGHWPGSAEPGQIGNSVIGGHRTARNAVFRYIGDLQPGDEIIYTTATGRHVYRVSGHRVVAPEEIWIIEPTPTATTTLFACHPPGSVTQRIAVFADLVSSDTGTGG